MKVNGIEYQSVYFNSNNDRIELIDQRLLPFEFRIVSINSIDEVINCISNMTVRGAPAIGIIAAWGIRMAVRDLFGKPEQFEIKCRELIECRPTAVNLEKGAGFVKKNIDFSLEYSASLKIATESALQFALNEVNACKEIGSKGLELIADQYKNKKRKLNILTHCNAGWLACGDWGTALSPVFMAHRMGIPLHVWVDETRPRNQGAKLTAWELFNENIPFSIIPDNSGGLLMQRGEVDMVITGADRIAMNGDTANKTGTYLKAIAARHNNVPFYIAAPSSTFDFSIPDGNSINIEIRDGNEISIMNGIGGKSISEFRIIPEEYNVLNHAFDITPSDMISGFISEKGIFHPVNLKSLL